MKYIMAVLLVLIPLNLNAQNADNILQEMEKALTPKNYYCQFKTRTEGIKTKTMSGEIYYKKEVGSLSVITSPVKSKGMKILLVEDRIWLYIPGSSRPIPLSAADSFMGTAMSNSDIMESSYSKDYKASLLKDEEVEGELCYVLDLKPKTKSASYSRIIIWARKDYTIPIKMEMYAHSGRLYKLNLFDEIREMAGRLRPTHYTLINYVENNKKTEFWLLSLKEKNDMSNTIFTKENLMK